MKEVELSNDCINRLKQNIYNAVLNAITDARKAEGPKVDPEKDKPENNESCGDSYVKNMRMFSDLAFSPCLSCGVLVRRDLVVSHNGGFYCKTCHWHNWD